MKKNKKEYITEQMLEELKFITDDEKKIIVQLVQLSLIKLKKYLVKYELNFEKPDGNGTVYTNIYNIIKSDIKNSILAEVNYEYLFESMNTENTEDYIDHLSDELKELKRQMKLANNDKEVSRIVNRIDGTKELIKKCKKYVITK